MDRTVSEPAHPYTQLRLDSVPSSDPTKRWPERRATKAVETSELQFSADACVFVSRCPQVMEICHQQRPDYCPVEPGREAACFLYHKSQ